MSIKSGDEKSVTLSPLNVTMEQSPDMTLFSITDYKLVGFDGLRRGINMTIKMKRKILSEMMTTYFPSLLLMMITYATTFFKPFFFEAALSVNLTTMLVMTTIFISKMEGLPHTSDVKMIDYWLILCQLVPFVQVVLLTAKEFLRDEEQEGNQVFDKEEIKVGEDYEPKAAWTWGTSNKAHSRACLLTMLTMTGKVFIRFLGLNRNVLSEKKVMPVTVLLASVLYFSTAAYSYFK